MYLDLVGKGIFHGLLAPSRSQLFPDAEIAELYFLDNGQIRVRPSILATALLLQTHGKVNDAEANPEPTSTSGGRWRWGLKSKVSALQRAHSRCSAPS